MRLRWLIRESVTRRSKRWSTKVQYSTQDVEGDPWTFQPSMRVNVRNILTYHCCQRTKEEGYIGDKVPFSVACTAQHSLGPKARLPVPHGHSREDIGMWRTFVNDVSLVWILHQTYRQRERLPRRGGLGLRLIRAWTRL
jgi:hypothetical protein